MPKSAVGPPGLWLAVRMMPPKFHDRDDKKKRTSKITLADDGGDSGSREDSTATDNKSLDLRISDESRRRGKLCWLAQF